MQFYKIYGDFINVERDSEDDDELAFESCGSRRDRQNAKRIFDVTNTFNKSGNKSFCFLSERNDERATFGVITTVSIKPSDYVRRYAKAIELDVSIMAPEEVTLSGMRTLLGNARGSRYIEDDDEVLERFGIDELGRHHGLQFGENIIECSGDENYLIKSAKKLHATKTLVPELKRIYAGGAAQYASGHPVHYIVECDDRDTRREMYKVLLDALYANARLDNSRYAYLDFAPGKRYSKMLFESLYKVSEGGTVVIRYLADNDTEDFDDTATNDTDTIENICNMAQLYRNKVLTVLCLPLECKRVKAQFYEKLGTLTFIELKEDYMDGTGAREFLSGLAAERHIAPDDELFSEIAEEGVYYAPELTSVFDLWYNEKLRTVVYPQYKDIAAARCEEIPTKPQGTAYEELMEMTGLTEAKSVIKKALNYYKMQSLYEKRGIKRDSPAMHMIFTGNPGTAKTTVARLFARIMKENGLLSRGQLVEVGRGDLVGRFVGWTAQTVQKKFNEAIGGVLFIDEAYSLVDDRDGSYGDEAINTIVQEMENHRADVVVIFAGYPDKMNGFLAKNPGLRSRIAFHVPFADYSADELCHIADHLSKKSGITIDAGAYEKLGRAFELARTKPDFGNGRYVRNLLEQARMNQASRLLEGDFDAITTEAITTLTAEDIIIPEARPEEAGRIGFC